MSPRHLLKARRAHCIEGALFAAAALACHGHTPLLMDFQTLPEDEDHVLAIFKQNGLWGAISKTNHSTIRWRDPVYKTPRELAMSYFHEYIIKNGRKTLRAFSKPFDLRKYKPETWVTADKDLWWLAEELDASPHYKVVPAPSLRGLRKADKIELETMKILEWKNSGRKSYR